MPELSPSQEIETEYIAWHAPEPPAVVFRRRVIEGVHLEVTETFAQAPHRGAETGGILLGRRDRDRIWVEDFEPVPCEHRFGPSYTLSEGDRALLDETLGWFRGGAQVGLEVLGFYRSQTLPDGGLCEDDEDLIRGYFRETEDLILLIQPSLQGCNLEDFRILFRGRGPESFIPVPLPVSETAEAPEDVDAAEERHPVRFLGETSVSSWPDPRPRSDPDTGLIPNPRWLWYAAVVALGVIGGALGYFSLQRSESSRNPSIAPHPATSPATILPAAASVPSPQAEPAASATGFGERDGENPPASATPDTKGIRELLDRWSSAVKHGDAQAAALCYAPVVSTYFGRHQVSRDAVRQSIRQSSVRYGGLDIYRISGVQINPVSENQVVVSFRKHWQTARRRKFAGEEQERMTVVFRQGKWQISSEQQEKIYWARK